MYFFLLSGAKNDESLGSTKVNCLISYNLLGCVTLTFSRNFMQHFWSDGIPQICRFERVPSQFLNISGCFHIINDLNFQNQSMFSWICNF